MLLITTLARCTLFTISLVILVDRFEMVTSQKLQTTSYFLLLLLLLSIICPPTEQQPPKALFGSLAEQRMFQTDRSILETRTREGTNGRTSVSLPVFSLFDDSYRILNLYLPLPTCLSPPGSIVLMGFTDGF